MEVLLFISIFAYATKGKGIMEKKRTREQVVEWMKAAQKRQQDWQQEVKLRWAECQQEITVAV